MNKIILVFIYLVSFLAMFFLGSENGTISISIISLILLMHIYNLIKLCFKGMLTVIDVVILFLSIYLYFGGVYYGSPEFRALASKLFSVNIGNNQEIIDAIYLVFLSLLFFNAFISMLNLRLSPLKPIKYLQKKSVINIFGVVLLSVTIIFSFYVYMKTNGRYLHFSDEGEIYFNTLGSLIVYSSSFLVIAFSGYKHYEKKWFYVLTLMLVLLLTMMSVRMFAAVLLFSILLNYQIRGGRFNVKVLLFLSLIFALIISRSIFRFQTFDMTNVLLTQMSLVGEFFIPSISTYYFFENAVDYNFLFNWTDLITQMLPSNFRSFARLYEFRLDYISNGQDPWPIGGLLFVGQFYFYFSFFGFIVYFYMMYFLLRIKSNLQSEKFTLWYAVVPIFCMVLPRMELWTLRAVLVNIVLLIVFKVILSKPRKSVTS